jgi:hypothetical protein
VSSPFWRATRWASIRESAVKYTRPTGGTGGARDPARALRQLADAHHVDDRVQDLVQEPGLYRLNDVGGSTTLRL